MANSKPSSKNTNQVLDKEVVINFESVLPFFSNKAHTSSTIGEISVNEEDTLLYYSFIRSLNFAFKIHTMYHP
jgi:hypothetical protein